MDASSRTSHPTSALAVFLLAALVASIGFAERADSKRFSQKVIKSVSKKRLAGAYKGVSEEGTPVSFRLTKGGKIVDFTVPVNLGCETENADLDGDGRINDSVPGEITKFTKTITLRSAPQRGRKATPHYPLGMTFEYATPPLPDSQPPLGTEVVLYEIKTKFKDELFSGPGANIYWPIPKRAAAVRRGAVHRHEERPPDVGADARPHALLPEHRWSRQHPHLRARLRRQEDGRVTPASSGNDPDRPA